MRRRLAHRAPRRPVLACALGFCAGAFACASGSPASCMAAAALSLLLAALLGRVSLTGLWFVLCFGLLGFLRFDLSRAPGSSADLRFHQDSDGQIIFYGRTVGEADVRPQETRWVLAADSVAYPDSVAPRTGRVLARFRFDPGIPPHAAVKLAGRLVAPAPARYPGDFSWSDYLSRKNIQTQFEPAQGSAVLSVTPGAPGFLGGVVAPVRTWIKSKLGAHLEGEERALALGLLLGERSEISPQTLAAFKQTGTLHLLAVSGSNVGVVAAAIWGALQFFRVGRWARILVAALGTVLFCHVAHLEASVVRAGGAALLVLGALAFRRRVDPLHVWGLVLLTFALWDPSALLDVGFQLSFTATLGILLWPAGKGPAHPSLPRRAFQLVRVSFLVSWAAQLGTLAVLLNVFHQIPLVTPLANLACVPLAGCATLGTLFVILLSPLGEPFAALTAAALWAFLKALLWAVHAAFRLGVPVVSIPRPAALELAVISFAVLALFALAHGPRYSRRLLLGAVVATATWVWSMGRQSPPEAVVMDAPRLSALLKLSSGETWWIGSPAGKTTMPESIAHSLGWQAPRLALPLEAAVEAQPESSMVTAHYAQAIPAPDAAAQALTIWCLATDSLPIGVVVQHAGQQFVLSRLWPEPPWTSLGLDSSALWIVEGSAAGTASPAGRSGRRPVIFEAGDGVSGREAVQDPHTQGRGYLRIRFRDGRFQTEPGVR